MEDSKFKYNPFAGIDKEDIKHVIILRFDVRLIVEKIRSEEKLLIELVGKKGRGKTTHLTYLQQHTSEFPIYFLNARNNYYQEILNDMSDVVFIDSIHHLYLFQRINVFRVKRIVIFTTHYSRKHEYMMLNKASLKIKFKGIDKETLKQLVIKRLQQASKDTMTTTVNDAELERLILEYKDDYRAIVNHLYDKFQRYE